MALVRAILLVDGENLVFRYQEMLKDSSLVPKDNNIFEKDIFVWNQEIQNIFEVDIFRVNYFSSVVGDDTKIKNVKDTLSKINYTPYGNYYRGCQLHPCIYKKEKQSNKSRLVDINIAVEAMRIAYSDSIDVICIISGDGDFLELYQDIMKRGKQVCVASLSSGLNPAIPHSVDRFMPLDKYFFKTKAEVEALNTKSTPDTVVK